MRRMMPRATRRRLWLLALLIIVAGLVFLGRAKLERATPGVAAPSPSARLVPQVTARLSAADVKEIGDRIQVVDGFGSDIAFLLVASVRERCSPAHAHELARMAVRAQLPVLQGTAAVTENTPALERPIYALVDQLSRSAPCHQALSIRIGAASLDIDPETYAAAFPDSYFDSGLDRIPAEFSAEPLGQRANDECLSIAYATLPLGNTQWQCRALRSSARARVTREVCAAQLEADGLPRYGVPLTNRFGREIAPKVGEVLEAIPEACR